MWKYVELSEDRACTLDLIAHRLAEGLGDKAAISAKKDSIVVRVTTEDQATQDVTVALRGSKIVVAAILPAGARVALALVKAAIIVCVVLNVGLIQGVVAALIMAMIFLLIIRLYWTESAELVKQQIEQAFSRGTHA
jgi:hypothetical protein